MAVIVGVIGNGVAASEELVQEALADAQAKAKKAKQDIEFKVAIEPDPSASLAVVLQWLVDEELTYELVVHTTVKGELGEFGEKATKTLTTKTPTVTLVDKLIAEEGAALFVLLPEDDDETTNEVRASMQKAAGSEIEVFNLTKGLVDEAGMEQVQLDAEDGPDYAKLGKDADADDADAQERLNELGAELDPPLAEGDYKTWKAFASAIEKAQPIEEEETEDAAAEGDGEVTSEDIDVLLEAIVSGEPITIGDEEIDAEAKLLEIGGEYSIDESLDWEDYAAAVKEALTNPGDGAQRAADKDDDAPSGWTADKVKGITDLSELRTITSKSGGGAEAMKWNRAKCTEFLLSQAPAEEEPEAEKPKPSSKSKATKGGDAPTIAQRIEQAGDMIAAGVQALVNAILDGSK